MPKSVASISAVLNFLYRGETPAGGLSASWTLHLATASTPTEEAGSGYTEQAIAFEKSGGGASSGGANLQNDAQIDFVSPEDEDWGVVTHVFVKDDNAMIVGVGALSSPVDLSSTHPETTIRFAAGAVVAAEA